MDAAGPPGPDPFDDLPPLVDVDGSDVPNSNNDIDDVDVDPLSDSTRTCFICLQTPDEDPTAAWVAPCPCTLTAHQECLLLWIDGKEHANRDAVEAIVDDDDDDDDLNRAGRGPGGRPLRQGARRQPRQRQMPNGLRPTRKVRCPACNAPIYTLEAPPDFWVHLDETLASNYRHYLAPHILATMAATMAIAGSSYYGFSMFMSVAGPDKVIPWLAGGRLYQVKPFDLFQPNPVRTGPARLLSHPADVLRTNARMAVLGLIAPSLLLHRALPFFTYMISLPLSWLWSVSLAVQRYRTTGSLAVAWPPSAAFCMAALPSIGIAYDMLYHRLVGRFERRLDQALGHALESYVEQNNNNNNNGGPAAADNAQNADNEHAAREEGIFGLVRRLGGVLVNMVRGNDGNNDAGEHGDGGMFGVFNDNEHIEFQIEVVVEERGGDALDDGEWDDDAAPPPNIERRPRPAQPQQQQQQQPAPPAPANNNDNPVQLIPERLSMRSIVAASTTQLLLPSIASTIGDLLRLVLPASLTKPARYPGQANVRFLGQRWARSLVGGALFVVLRDLFKLYGKYRRVQTRGQRMVKNYDRKKHREDRRRAEAARERERQQQRELVAVRDAQIGAVQAGLAVEEVEEL